MASTTVRITLQTSEALRVLAASTGRSMQDVLAAAVEAYSRQLLLDRTNEGYAALRESPERWREELEERTGWEATLADNQEQG